MARPAQQFLRALHVEARVGAQKLDELLEASRETDALDDSLHLAADAPDFGESELVNLAG